MTKQPFYYLAGLMKQLRAPDGCPWDAEQTHDSLKRYLIEECYEVIEAIDDHDDELLKEELGDLLLQPLFHAAIAEERGAFTIDDVIQTVSDKLIRRHPHVFGTQIISSSKDQVKNWELIKSVEKGNKRNSTLSGVPPHLPAILKAHKITEKAARVGFDWDSYEQVLDKIKEEMVELEETLLEGNELRIEEELGDLLFAVVNLGRFLSLDPENALRKTVARFTSRFNYIEESLAVQGTTPQLSTLDEMEKLWVKAKEIERKATPHK